MNGRFNMKEQIQNFEETAIDKMDSLKYKINDEMTKLFIIPFCKKYHLTFLSGNGTYLFMNHNRKSLLHPYSDNLPDTTNFLKEYHVICDLIDDMQRHTNMLGDDYEG